MGLRFRKSVTLCKGVRLNFGKTGASLTFGQKGFHKTISTSGRVTTSIGIPGTGIYYTDTQQIGGRRNSRNTSTTNRGSVLPNSSNSSIERLNTAPATSSENAGAMTDSVYRSDPITIDSITQEEILAPEVKHVPVVEVPIKDNNPNDNVEWDEKKYEESIAIKKNVRDVSLDFFMDPIVSIRGVDNNMITERDEVQVYVKKDALFEIYAFCDPQILWNDILLGNTAEDLGMDYDTWRYCKSVSSQIVAGDIDTFLQVIEHLAPVDDLLLYGSDFGFGTDNSEYLETEFVIYPEELLENGKKDDLLLEYAESVSLRVARDIMAMLPIERIIINVICDSRDLLSCIFERQYIETLDYENNSIAEIMKNTKNKVYPLDRYTF